MFLFCLVFAMFCARLFICALWSPAGKGLTSWLSFVVSSCVCHFPIGILGQVWYLIVSIPDLYTITYFCHEKTSNWTVSHGETLGLVCVLLSCVFVTFPYAVSCQVRYLIVSIPGLYRGYKTGVHSQTQNKAQ